MLRRLNALIFTVLVGCSGTSNPPADRCAGVRCMRSDVCNSTTGRCEAPDAGIVDAGGRVDAGLPDAGTVDAGEPDAGEIDAGLPDAGPLDAGLPDAGQPPIIDAGCTDDSFCNGVAHCDPITRDCVECFLPSHCPASIPACDVRVHQCVGCVAGSDCANPTPICDQAQCLPCNSDAECGLGRRCNANTFACDPLNDTCTTARPILAAGTGQSTLVLTPAQGLDDVTLSCAVAGPELVYSFTVTSTQVLSATVTPGSAGLAAISLRTSCAGVDLACDAPTQGSAAINATLSPGTYFLFAETAAGAPGPVTMRVLLQPPVMIASNDTCLQPTSIAINGTTTTRAVLTGDTTQATNGSSTEPSCSATAQSTGPDLVYVYTLAAPGNVTLTVRPLGALHPVIAVRSACEGSGAEIACQTSTTSASIQQIIQGQPAGTYFVSIDSADGTSGAFQLEMTATPVVDNDACATPRALTFTNGTATATGDTTYATNGYVGGDVAPSCSDSARGTGRDLVYTYTLSQPQDVHVAVTATGLGPTFEPVISIRGSSCTDASRANEKACVSPLSSRAEVTLVAQPAGTYTLWVDSAEETAGPFQLEVTLSAATPPPANDSCATPEVLSFANDTVVFSGSTSLAANDNAPGDVSPTCNASAKQSGRDVVYQFTLTDPRDVRVQIAPSTGLIPSIYVRRASCGSQVLGDELICLTNTSSIDATLTRLPAGTYFLFVDSSGNTSGSFTGSLTRSAPTTASANDQCTGVQSLSFANDTATASGSMISASNSNTPSDNAPACGTDFLPRRYGRDLVYAYTLSATQDVDLTVTPSGALVPAIYVRSPNQCASFSAGAELACVATTQVEPLHVVLPNQIAGTYFLFVDSNGYGIGDFTLQVTRRTATPPPVNDTCFAPTLLTAAIATAGDTTAALDTYSSTSYASACRGLPFSGRDLVYRFNASLTGTATVVVTPSATFNPTVVLLQGTCGAAQCVRFSDRAGAGVPESFSFPVTAGQPSYLVVDSRDRELPYAFGRFSITVTEQ